jgi:hypothetical protein
VAGRAGFTEARLFTGPDGHPLIAFGLRRP